VVGGILCKMLAAPATWKTARYAILLHTQFFYRRLSAFIGGGVILSQLLSPALGDAKANPKGTGRGSG